MDVGFIFTWLDASLERRLRQLSWMFTTYLLFGKKQRLLLGIEIRMFTPLFGSK